MRTTTSAFSSLHCSFFAGVFLFSSIFIFFLAVLSPLAHAVSLLEVDSVRIPVFTQTAAMQQELPTKLCHVVEYAKNRSFSAGGEKSLLARFPQRPSNDALWQYVLDPEWKPLIQRLIADGLPEKDVYSAFLRLGPNSYCVDFMGAKITELYGVGTFFIAAKRAEDPLIPPLYQKPVTDLTAASCLKFIAEHKEDLDTIATRYGVPAHIIVGILLIETGLGENLGDYSALQALASMAVTTDTAILLRHGNKQVKILSASALQNTLRVKSAWAYNEVKALLLHASSTGENAADIPGSMYGAVGLCQFMPSNIARFGVDGDDDGIINLFSPADAMYSIAHYLSENGWRPSGDDAHKRTVIFSYNHNWGYVANVMAVANHLSLASQSKVALSSIPLGAASHSFGGRGFVDKYLARRGGYVPPRARISELGGYESILTDQ